MDLYDILKQLKKIEPDSTYAAISKRSILAQEPAGMPNGILAGEPAGAYPTNRSYRSRAQRTFWKIIETGAAVALTGFFIMLLTGAFNGSVSPQYSAIDANALHAEAQAIDIQIQLSKLNYAAPTGTAASIMMAGRKPAGAASNAASTTATAPSSAPASATGTLTIDQALQSLTQ